MLGRTTNRVLLVGIGVSALLHLSGAWVWYALGNATPSKDDFATPEVHDKTPDPKHRIDLGDPESRAVSMSWIGFDEYKKHIAMPAEVDQPDLTMDPASPASGAAGGMAAAAMAMQDAASAARAEAQRALEQMAAGLKAVGDWAKILPEGTQEVSDTIAAGENPRPTEAEAQKQEQQRAEAEQQAKQAATQETREEQAKREQTGEQPAMAQGKAGSGQDTGASAQRAVEGETGRQDDRESDPTSIDRSALGNPGQPLAARGLRIRTVKPRFSHYTSIMSSRGDPVVRIYFNRAGVATKVDLLQPSGNPDIDRPVLDAAYRWTASGESLKALGSDETVTVDVRILL